MQIRGGWQWTRENSPICLTRQPDPQTATSGEVCPGWLFGPGRRPELLRVILVLLIPAVVLVGTLRFDFVFDDDLVILQDPLVIGPLDLPAILGSRVRVVDITLGYFRPLITLLYRLDWRVWGANPGGFHLTNLWWHLLTTLLVYSVASAATGDIPASWLGAALFGVLPAHTEAVGWIQGRVDMVSAALALLALLALLRGRDTAGRVAWAWGGLSGIALLAALAAKESAAALPLAWLCWEACIWQGRARACLVSLSKRLAPLALATCIYGLFRWSALGGAGGFSLGLAPVGPRILGLLAALAEYGRVLMLPDPSLNFHRILWAAAGPKGAAIAVAVPVVLGGALWITWRRIPALFPWVAWIPITLTPPLLFIFYRRATEVGFYTAERFLYLPSVGWCVLLGWLLARLLRERELLIRRSGQVIACSLLAGYIGLTMVRLLPWADPVDLYQAMKAQADLSPAIRDFVHNDLGRVYIQRGEFQQARQELQIALRRRPDYALAHNNMGVLLIHEGQPAEARPWLERAIRMNPKDSTAYGNLGIAFEAMGDAAAARRAYEAGLRVVPDSAWLKRRLAKLSDQRLPSSYRKEESP